MNNAKKKLPTTAITAALLLLFLFVGVLVFVASIRVSGSATLANGSRIGITAKGFGFGVSENKGTTRIEAGGYIASRRVTASGSGEP